MQSWNQVIVCNSKDRWTNCEDYPHTALDLEDPDLNLWKQWREYLLSNLKQCMFVKVCLFDTIWFTDNYLDPDLNLWKQWRERVLKSWYQWVLFAESLYSFTPSNIGRLICSCIFAGSLLLHSGFNLKDKTKLNLVFLSTWLTIRISSTVADHHMCDCNEKKHTQNIWRKNPTPQ